MRILLLLGFFAAQAWGCSCGGSPTGNPPCQSAWQSAAVFTGMVMEITEPAEPLVAISGPADFPQRKVRFQIREALSGVDSAAKEVVVLTGRGGGDCGYDFHRGADYIVYASKGPSGALSTGICSLTRPLADATAELEYFHHLPDAPPTSEVRVTAYDVNAAYSRTAGSQQLPGLAGAQITLTAIALTATAATDATGRHVFPNLPPGEYKVEVALENFTTLGPSRPFTVHAKGCAEIGIPLQLDRTVSGRILTRAGDPISGVLVEAVPRRPRYENELPFAAESSTTDANGSYTLRSLKTGDYYLGVSLSRTPSLEAPYTRWFYPGTEDPAAAALLQIDDKPESLRRDLTLPDPQHARQLAGTVFWPDGRPASDVRIVLEDPRWPWMSAAVAAMTDAAGKFSVPALDGTRYRIHADIFQRAPISAEPLPIAGGGSVKDLKLVLTRQSNSLRDGVDDALKYWRSGLGLR